MFTGDRSGDFLYRSLHRLGFSSQSESRHREDGMTLYDCYITAAVRCAPPDNRPAREEQQNCFPYLSHEFDLLPNLQALLALGKIAFDATIALTKSKGIVWGETPLVFGHGTRYEAANRPLTLFASYHTSQQNTQTGKLTEEMFMKVLEEIRSLLPDR